MTIVSDDRKIVIFLCEKCASTSIREALIGREDWRRIPGKLIQKSEWDDYERIGITRSPYSRMVSYWKYWVKIGVTDLSFSEFVLTQNIAEHSKSVVNWYRDIQITRWWWFERIQSDFDTLELDVELPHLNAADADPPYDYYRESEEALYRVTLWGKDDFDLFGYAKMKVKI